MHNKFWLEILNGRDRFGDPRVGESITLKSILKEIGEGTVDWIRPAQAHTCEPSSEASGLIKGEEFTEQPRNDLLLKDSAP
jgi:hypothetical protein